MAAAMQRNAAAFDRFAPTWDADHGPGSPRAGEFSARLGLLRGLCAGGRRVLELGCGTGLNLVALSPVIAQGVGVDFSPAMILHARANAARAGVRNLRFVLGDVLDPCTGSEPFDVIILAGTLEHLADPGAALASCRKRLARGGRVVVIAPHRLNPCLLWQRLRGSGGRLFAGDRHPVPRELAALARRNGLVRTGLHALPCRPSHEGEAPPPAWVRHLTRAAGLVPLPATRGAFALVLEASC